MLTINVLLVIFSLFYAVSGQEKPNCNAKETCSDCIQTLGCIWCSKPYSSVANGTSAIYCANEDIDDTSNWCPTDKIVIPQQEQTITKNDPLQSQKDGSAVQIRPQKIKLSLRKGEEFHLPFQYRQAENYPVDLYYIMDLSASMEPHREKLAQLGGKVAEAMRNLTSNFRLGFGSFVDKTDMPFISTVPAKLQIPCTLEKKNQPRVICVPPYSFKNHMSLTDNAVAFSAEVRKAKVSGNLDFPEGGFDAVMQAMVCKKEIGWREKARHLIVFSTDADFHIAGDGRLAGVVEPNDATCHMHNNKYTHDLVYDYPSVSQINYVAKQNNINLIFAIVKKENDRILKIYEKLQQRIENSVAGGLTQNSENVVTLIQENYNKIVDSVIITDNSGNEVEIKYSSNCVKPKENGCTNIHAGEIINFTASIRPLNCQPPGSPPQLIKIKPEGIDESLEVELEVICDCPCEKLNHPDFSSHSLECASQGDLKCGVCSCYPGRFGRNCECDSSTSNTDDVSACKANSNDTEICSGLGSCKCGKCECVKRPAPQIIYGKFCQCDNYSCKRNNGQVCSGREKGNCDCGQCKCLAGWTGEACECPDTNTTCIAPGSGGSVCSGHGNCACGECQCNMVDGYRYSGRFCDECPSCPGQRCEELRHCVECQAYKTGIYNEDECNIKCTAFVTEIVDKIEEDGDVEEDVKICRSPDNSGCTIIFQYTYDINKELMVKAQKTKICSESVDILALVLGVIGSIVLAGIVLLIIWKVCTSLHDRREYAKFENERASAKWQGGDNPLYKKATSEFKNPLYKQ